MFVMRTPQFVELKTEKGNFEYDTPITEDELFYIPFRILKTKETPLFSRRLLINHTSLITLLNLKKVSIRLGERIEPGRR